MSKERNTVRLIVRAQHGRPVDVRIEQCAAVLASTIRGDYWYAECMVYISTDEQGAIPIEISDLPVMVAGEELCPFWGGELKGDRLRYSTVRAMNTTRASAEALAFDIATAEVEALRQAVLAKFEPEAVKTARQLLESRTKMVESLERALEGARIDRDAADKAYSEMVKP